jgi:putative transposase
MPSILSDILQTNSGTASTIADGGISQKRQAGCVKYEAFYLRAHASVADACAAIGRYLGFDNSRRPHASLDRKTPDQAYFNRLPQVAAA